ncbi:MAG: hypothetical protein ACFFD2_22660 [Promethearchaeota archaeon]
MVCNELGDKLKAFLEEIPLYSPFQIGQSIILKIDECILEVSKEKRGFQIIINPDFKEKLVLKFKDVKAFEYLFEAKDLIDYGNRLVTLSTQGKIIMDIGPFKNPMKRGFHRFISYLKKTGGLQTYICIVPTF